jgi:hypothetical protein
MRLMIGIENDRLPRSMNVWQRIVPGRQRDHAQ